MIFKDFLIKVHTVFQFFFQMLLYGFFSEFYYHCSSSLAWTGFKRSLTSDDLWSLTPPNRSSTIVPLFQRHWQARVQKAARKNADLIQVRHKSIIDVTVRCSAYESAKGYRL
jgi:hypothetical protein